MALRSKGPGSPSSHPLKLQHPYLVHLSLARIQSFLVQTPRLRAIVGANAKLGEVVRGQWLGGRFRDQDGPPQNLPVLACRMGATSLDVAPSTSLRPLAKDPLGNEDDPAGLAGLGVLARDGGNFEALFPSKEEAMAFAVEAEGLLSRELPGISWSTHIRPLGSNRPEQELADSKSEALADFPYAHVCEASGAGTASTIYPLGPEDRVRVSPASLELLKRGDAFDGRPKGVERTRDVLGRMREGLLDSIGKRESEFPSEFSEIGRSGSLAIIQLDGNAIGARSLQYSPRESHEDNADPAAEWSRRETFFHILRTSMRIAFSNAFARKLSSLGISKKTKVPARPLMLGGDDLLFLIDAPLALPFLAEFEKELRETSKKLLPKGEEAFTIGAGVAFVRLGFPFYRAHEISDSLVASAKRQSRGGDSDTLTSAVDWLNISQSWQGDLIPYRLSENRGSSGAHRALACRPVPIASNPQEGAKRPSLAKLLADASKLADMGREAARSQLRGLVASLDRGYYEGILAARLLPRPLRDALVEWGYLTESEHGWSPWFASQEAGDSTTGSWTTLPDLVDVFELERLKRLTYPKLSKSK